MKIDVIGCGSAFSEINNTSSIHIEDQEHNQWLIDCGPTVPRALWQRGIEVDAIQTIYFTHIHPDHSSGLAALINQWKSFQRTEPLDIFCQLEQQPLLKSLVALAIWPATQICFDIRWHDILSEFRWRHWRLQTAHTQHEMSNCALRLTIDDHTLFYSGDGRATPASQALMAGADIAFQECASFNGLDNDASHGDLPDCLRLLSVSGVKELGLYHCFDGALSSLRESVETLPNVFISHDGLFFDLTNRV
ncbi:MAG: MBL fold metallo-hydrolase [Marinomonas sp.]